MRKGLLALALLGSSLAYGAVTVTVNGTSYTIPQNNEKGWGTSVTSWIQAASQHLLQKTGGSFTLSADVDFGPSFGLKGLYFKSETANIASTGVFRLANTDSLVFRNSLNSADLSLKPNAATDGVLQYNGVDLVGTTLTQTLTNKTISGSSNTLSNIPNSATTATNANTASAIVARDSSGNFSAGTITANLTGNASGTALNVTGTVAIANGGTGQTAKTAAFDALSPNAALGDVTYHNGTNNVSLSGNTTTTKKFLRQTGNGTVSAAPAWDTLVAGDVPSLDASKITTGQLAVANGGTAIASFTSGDILYATGSTTLAKLPIGSNGTILKVASSLPSWASPSSSSLSVASKTSNYTLTSTDDVITGSASGGAFTFTLPAASSVPGKVYKLVRTDSTLANAITIARAGSDTIGVAAATSKHLMTQGETWEIMSDGTSNWIVLNHQANTPWTSYTPTIAGFGTVTINHLIWRRIGDAMQISANITAGTVVASAASILLPTGATVSSLIANNTPVANLVVDSNSAIDDQISINGASLTDRLNFARQDATNNGFTLVNGSNIIGTGGRFAFTTAAFPITNWEAN